jgi:hypothetical protein
MARAAAFNIQGLGVALVPVKQPRFPITTGLLAAGWEGTLGANTKKVDVNNRPIPSAENMLLLFIASDLLLVVCFQIVSITQILFGGEITSSLILLKASWLSPI